MLAFRADFETESMPSSGFFYAYLLAFTEQTQDV